MSIRKLIILEVIHDYCVDKDCKKMVTDDHKVLIYFITTRTSCVAWNPLD